jgi:fatty acid CoA ligase FadD36
MTADHRRYGDRMSVLGGIESAEPDRPAVTVDGRTLTRAELFAAAAVVADRVHGGPVVAIDASPSLETVVAVTGCLLAGVTAVPVPPDAGPLERQHIVADAGAGAWLSASDDDTDLETIPVRAGERSGTRWQEPADGTALLLYTSGTTGPPKGVPMTRAALVAGLDGLRAAWDWQPDDRLVHGLPLFHVHGLVLGVLGAFRVGSPLVHTGRPRPEAYAAAQGTLYFGVPTVWGRIAADPASARALRRARLLVSGSAGLPGPVFAALQALAGQGPVERYGMTETLITLAMRADQERRPGWVGGPIAGVQARLRDDDGHPVPADGESIGNLEVRGATVFGGYHRAPAADAASFTADGWFRTGDAAVVDADDRHRIIGRARDDLIKTGGYRVGAGEVEAALLTHPDVSEAAVVGAADADLGQRIVAYVVTTAAVTEQALIDHVAGQLSVHKRPRHVAFVAELPRNALGKVQKSLLR